MKSTKIIFFILTIVILLGSTQVLAHPQKATVIGCEDVGWIEMEDRHNKNTIIGYKFDSSVTTAVKEATRAGTAKWKDTVTIGEKTLPILRRFN